MKNFLKKYWAFILIALFLVTTVWFYLKSVNQEKQITNLKADNTLLTQSVDTFRDKNNMLVYEQEVAVYESNKKIKQLSDEVFDLKRKNDKLVKQVNYYGQVNQETRIDSVYIAYNDTVYLDTVSIDYLRVPKTFAVKNSNYSVGGTVLKNGVILDNISVPNILSYREIEQKQGWFKSPVTVVQIHNSNPYVYTTGMTTVTVKSKTSAWHRWILPTLTAVGAGVITYQIVK